jgi:hypothetical protein
VRAEPHRLLAGVVLLGALGVDGLAVAGRELEDMLKNLFSAAILPFWLQIFQSSSTYLT